MTNRATSAIEIGGQGMLKGLISDDSIGELHEVQGGSTWHLCPWRDLCIESGLRGLQLCRADYLHFNSSIRLGWRAASARYAPSRLAKRPKGSLYGAIRSGGYWQPGRVGFRVVARAKPEAAMFAHRLDSNCVAECSHRYPIHEY